ncbi:hypothetical protein PHLGIDRAFT_126171 [Phlebiopsis gigantea 11061_1 CR5-6]|uniref:DAGKc domain-containing protein n=1 Tax=Phlebiopsis gigantea (strain 11061_1 CR5-6) TaxID=745531 RepID=A0A0C3SAX3_PHLG1|nr:hypothetical protein PHLGIDRAFT_126171 [Phlebiopsis gigantea 11061_1 CR5-6]
MAVAIDPATKVKELSVNSQHGTAPAEFVLTDTSLYVKRPKDPKFPEILAPLRHVLWAETVDGTLEISVVVKKSKKKAALALVHISGKVEGKEEEAKSFADAVLEAAYRGVKKYKHILVLVNPIAGPGKSRQHLVKKIQPILKAARCTHEDIITTHYKHAWEIARELPLDKYDVIATVSGDGIIHEILNGFAEHTQPVRAMQTPLCPIPGGSANALSLNLLGLEEGFDISAATVNAVKGLPMNVDVCSVTQGDKRFFSFMTQAIGLMAELDLGTEHLRFMGDNRFVYGYLRGLLRHKACPVKVSIKAGQSDKQQMLEHLRAGEAAAAQRVVAARGAPAPVVVGEAADVTDPPSTDPGLPPLVHRYEPGAEGWLEFDRPLLYLFGGKGPLVARDLLQFPMSLPDDGYVDIVVQERLTRKEMLKAMDGAEVGKTYWMDSQHYFKAVAYRVEPHNRDSCLSVDGEGYPFEPFEVEVHKGLATLLSPYGVYNVKFSVPDIKKPK